MILANLGGAYYSPILSPGFKFLHYIQKELLKNDCDVGFAVVAYCAYSIL